MSHADQYGIRFSLTQAIVLYGANSDLVWLQQDLYSVNTFYTFHVSRVLDFPRRGLAALLEMYCDFSQISDTH
ncbi:hypothetical protein EDB89DRAFT_2008925, partial [Lactarius sanguifluus]